MWIYKMVQIVLRFNLCWGIMRIYKFIMRKTTPHNIDPEKIALSVIF